MDVQIDKLFNLVPNIVLVPHNTLSDTARKPSDHSSEFSRGDFSYISTEACLSHGVVSSQSRTDPAASGAPLQFIFVWTHHKQFPASSTSCPHPRATYLQDMHFQTLQALFRKPLCPARVPHGPFIFGSSSILLPHLHDYWEMNHLKLLPCYFACLMGFF